eukprot:TRINITY_DN775_c0_g5_i1.p1 TRINITY_DN775_c0_g5~~TRINITY_DN775_c0_g5_i1.p1  ORF type:complete len:1583 (+),score=471.53 TRINITY_DN775_c0_g5_i1:90-4838(+)
MRMMPNLPKFGAKQQNQTPKEDHIAAIALPKSKTSIDKWRLSFKVDAKEPTELDKYLIDELEIKYRQTSTKEKKNMIRILAGLLLIFNVFFVVYDCIVFSGTTLLYILLIRIVLLILSVVFMVFTIFNKSQDQLWLIFQCFLIGAGIVTYSIAGDDPGYGVTAIFMMLISNFTPLVFRNNTFIILALTTMFSVSVLTFSTSLENKSKYEFAGFIWLFAFFMVASKHSVEKRSRANFLSVCMMVEQQLKAKDEKQRSDALLEAMLPRKYIEKFKSRGPHFIAEAYQEVTVGFIQICNFDRIVLELDETEVVTLLNIVYSAVDHLIKDYDIHKVETVNEVYMVVAGCPVKHPEHALIMADFATSVMLAVEPIRDIISEEIPTCKIPLEMRIGLNSGRIVSGIIGQSQPRFKLFGDTVNTASRMESTADPGMIQVSPSTAEILKSTIFQIVERGPVAVKGKGDIVTSYICIDEVNPEALSSDEEFASDQEQYESTKQRIMSRRPISAVLSTADEDDEDEEDIEEKFMISIVSQSQPTTQRTTTATNIITNMPGNTNDKLDENSGAGKVSPINLKDSSNSHTPFDLAVLESKASRTSSNDTAQTHLSNTTQSLNNSHINIKINSNSAIDQKKNEDGAASETELEKLEDIANAIVTDRIRSETTLTADSEINNNTNEPSELSVRPKDDPCIRSGSHSARATIYDGKSLLATPLAKSASMGTSKNTSPNMNKTPPPNTILNMTPPPAINTTTVKNPISLGNSKKQMTMADLHSATIRKPSRQQSQRKSRKSLPNLGMDETAAQSPIAPYRLNTSVTTMSRYDVSEAVAKKRGNDLRRPSASIDYTPNQQSIVLGDKPQINSIFGELFGKKGRQRSTDQSSAAVASGVISASGMVEGGSGIGSMDRERRISRPRNSVDSLMNEDSSDEETNVNMVTVTVPPTLGMTMTTCYPTNSKTSAGVGFRFLSWMFPFLGPVPRIWEKEEQRRLRLEREKKEERIRSGANTKRSRMLTRAQSVKLNVMNLHGKNPLQNLAGKLNATATTHNPHSNTTTNNNNNNNRDHPRHISQIRERMQSGADGELIRSHGGNGISSRDFSFSGVAQKLLKKRSSVTQFSGRSPITGSGHQSSHKTLSGNNNGNDQLMVQMKARQLISASDLESSFEKDLLPSWLRSVFYSIVFALFFTAIFIVWDIIKYGGKTSELETMFMVRSCICATIFLFALYVWRCRTHFLKHKRISCWIILFCFGVGLVAISSLGDRPGYGIMATFIVYTYFLTIVPFFNRVILYISLIIIYLAVVSTFNSDYLSAGDVIRHGCYLMCFIVLQGIPVFFSERYQRVNHFHGNSLNKMEKTIKKEEERSTKLLSLLLPLSIVDELKAKETDAVIAHHFDCVTVLFTDLKGFTAFSSTKTPAELVQFLNTLYSQFDKILEKYGLWKVEVIGDAYFVVGGCNIPECNCHALRCAMAGQEMQSLMPAVRRETGHSGVKMRAGVHSGPCMSGVVGLLDPRYHVFGATCTIAERMESSGVPDCVHLSSTAHDLLKGSYAMHAREEKITIDDGSEMQTYILKDPLMSQKLLQETIFCEVDHSSFH